MHIHSKTPMPESFLDKVQGWSPAILLERDSSTGTFLWIFLFTNSYRITCVFPSVDIFSKNDFKRKNVTTLKENALLAKLKEECQENFHGELEAKQVKIIGCHVPRAPVPERLARFPWIFVESFTKYCCTKWCPCFL